MTFAEMPHAIDPEVGRMASANNRVVGPDYPHLITTRWEPPYRAERIEALLAARERHDIEGTAALQLDEVSLAARALLPLLLAAEPAPGAASDAHALLSRWDGDMDRNRREPLLFHAWVHSLNEILFADELGELFAEVARWNPLRLQRVLNQAPQWCEGPETADCAAALRLSLVRALVLVEELSGSDDPAQQLWGRVHRARLAHPVLTRVPVINRLVDVVIEAGGGNYTINRATPGARRGDRLFEMVHGPELRAIYDLSDLDNSRFMIASGQSGNIFSPLYDNLTDDWRDGLYLRLAEPLEETSRRLTLVPK
jgi:penicillin amidase